MVVHRMVQSVKKIKIWVVWVEKFEVHKPRLGFSCCAKVFGDFWRKNPLKLGPGPKSFFLKKTKKKELELQTTRFKIDGWLTNQSRLPPRKLTPQCKIRNLKMYFLLKIVIFHCHLSFRVCKELVHHPIETTNQMFFSGSTELSMIILNIWILKSFQGALHITQISIRSSMPQSFGLTLGTQKTTTDLPFHQPQHPGGLKNKSTEISRLGDAWILCSS